MPSRTVPQSGRHADAPADAAGLRVPSHLPLAMLVRLFDALPDVVFFAKDVAGRYVHANKTLVQRLRKRSPEEVLGYRAEELFPEPLGARYTAQDMRLLREGQEVQDQLELHLFANNARGWCLTNKFALHEGDRVVGLVGISRDLSLPNRSHSDYASIARFVERLRKHYDQPLRIADLAADAGLSMVQLERQVRRVFHLAPRQLLAKIRLDAALAALDATGSIASIAHACGYTDQSAFTRQFRAALGMSPTEYRTLRAKTAER